MLQKLPRNSQSTVICRWAPTEDAHSTNRKGIVRSMVNFAIRGQRSMESSISSKQPSPVDIIQLQASLALGEETASWLCSPKIPPNFPNAGSVQTASPLATPLQIWWDLMEAPLWIPLLHIPTWLSGSLYMEAWQSTFYQIIWMPYWRFFCLIPSLSFPALL